MPLVRRLPFALLLFAAVVSIGADRPTAFPAIPGSELENAYRVTDKVISGAAPEGDAAFRKLRDLGVNTTVRRNRGTDIDAACGQLAARASTTVELPPRPREVTARAR